MARKSSKNDMSYTNDMSTDERVMMAIVRAAEQFKKQFSALFIKHGLTFPQYNVLRVLDSSVEGQNTLKNVHRIMLVSGANMTGITKRLEKMGFIVRKNDPKDERLKWLVLTDKGKQVLSSIYEEKELSVQRFLKGYSDDKKSEILETLRTILNQGNGKVGGRKH